MPDSKKITVTCGQCSNFMQCDDSDEGLCFEWQQKKALCDSISELSLFWNQAIGGVDLLPDLERNCEHFSGRYNFVKGEY